MPTAKTDFKYSFSFTAASLRPEMAVTVAEHFLGTGSWESAKQAVLDSNALQARSPASLVRMEREIRQRLQTLTMDQLRLLPKGTADVRRAIAWLGAVKQSRFLFDFPAEVLRSKLELQDAVLRASDYERFLEYKTPDHPELARLRGSTSMKIRRVLFLMLREAGILCDGPELGSIERPVLPLEVEQCVRSDDSRWLASFLVPENEILNASGYP